MTDIGVAGGANDPNVEEVRILTHENGAMYRVFAPRYAWHCYDFLLTMAWEKYELIDTLEKWAIKLNISFEDYFRDVILHQYHSFFGNTNKIV